MTANAVKTTKREEPEWIVFALVAVALLAGWFLKMFIEGRTETFTDGNIAINYPAAWFREPMAAEQGLALKASDLHSASLYRPTLALQLTQAAPALPGTKEDRLTPTVTAWTFGNSQNLSNFRVLGTEHVNIAGQNAIRIDYTYVTEPIDSPYRRALPVVVEAVDYIIIAQDQAYVVTVAADAHDFEQAQDEFKTILDSLAFKG
jgi:hypothetical protein